MLNLKELYKNKNVVSLIPARGGSKGVPKKYKKDVGKTIDSSYYQIIIRSKIN